MNNNIKAIILTFAFLLISIVTIYRLIDSKNILNTYFYSGYNIEKNLIEDIRKDIEDTFYLEQIQIKEDAQNIFNIESFYKIKSKQLNLIAYLVIAEKQLLCDVCNDIKLSILLDIAGRIIRVRSLNPIEIEGEEIDPSDFLNQFQGSSEIKENEYNVTIHNLTGATISAEKSINLIYNVQKFMKVYINEHQTE